VKFKIFIIICLFCIFPFFASAKDYDFYVDESASSGGDGSEDEPFKNIEDAIEVAGKESGTQEIYIEDGEYVGDFTIGKSMRLIGESKDEVTISGTVGMDDDSEIKDITVKGGKTSISIDKDAEVVIEDCIIRDFVKIGVDIAPGSGKLVLKNSKIKDGKGKGIYVQRGNEIELSGNEVIGNDEEGFDLRSKISGFIKGNYIHKNGESGIEVIVGETDLKISGNTIKNNGASAIAAQFYEELNEKGDIRVENNSISGNDNYALNCKKTQGGSTSRTYWTDSITMRGNSISGNKDGSINKICHFDTVVSTNDDDKLEDKGKENEEAKRLEEEEERQEALVREQERLKEERAKRQADVKQILSVYETNMNSIENNLTKVRKESSLKVFFFGVDKKEIEALEVNLNLQKAQLEKLDTVLGGDYMKMSEGDALKDRVDNESEKNKTQLEYLNKRLKTFSLFGWIKNFF